MKTKRQIWDQIADLLTLKQYNQITNNANLKYDNYFNNTLKVTKSKKIVELAKQGLTAPLAGSVEHLSYQAETLYNKLVTLYSDTNSSDQEIKTLSIQYEIVLRELKDKGSSTVIINGIIREI